MILIISTCKRKLHELEFVNSIGKVLKESNIKLFIKHYSKINQKDLNKADKIIISGTSLIDNDFIKKENRIKFKWIKSINKPILGICAGAHIIALIFRCKVSNKKQMGKIQVNFKKDFLGLTKGEYEVYNLHGLCPKLNNKFEIYAQAQGCPQAFKHKTKQIYGVLFHPEVYQKDMIVNFCNFKE